MSMNNLGKSIPNSCKTLSRKFLDDISVKDDDGFIDKIVHYLECDLPDRAMNTANEKIDVTGSYRLIAILLTFKE